MRIAEISRWCRVMTAALAVISVVGPMALGQIGLAGENVHSLSGPRAGAFQEARVTPEQQKAIDAYVAELKRVNTTQRTSLENLLLAAYRVESVLMYPAAPQEPRRPAVDELSPEELQRIRDQLNGVDIHVGDTVSVMPDREFFLWRAKSNGGSVDVEFFALLNRAYPPSGWPVWIERTGAETGCVDFTSGELVDLLQHGGGSSPPTPAATRRRSPESFAKWKTTCSPTTADCVHRIRTWLRGSSSGFLACCPGIH